MVFSEGDVAVAQESLGERPAARHEGGERVPDFEEWAGRESPEGGEQEVLHVYAGDLLLVVMEGADAGVVLAEAGEGVGDGVDVRKEGHPPPEVCVFREWNGTVAAGVAGGFDMKRYAGVAEGEQASAVHDATQGVGGAVRGAEAADGVAVCMVARAGAEHSGVGVG